MKTFTFEDFSIQGEAVHALQKQIEGRSLVHALLICGEPGTGKKTLAGVVASSLMCKSQGRIPCGVCPACVLAASGEHPDIIIIEKGSPLSAETPKGRSTIPVDDIREMIRLCSQYSFDGGNRVVIIRDAENLTVQAQNCLLKILEEPAQNNYFILTTSHPDQLLITVKSRCRTLKLHPWDTSTIQRFLTETGIAPETAEKAAAASFGSIGNALLLATDDGYWKMREEIMNSFFRNRTRGDILKYSTGWKDRKNEADNLFNILEDNLHRLLMYRFNPGNSPNISDFPEEWRVFAEKATEERFVYLTAKITDARKQSSYNVNFQAIIEQLLLAFIGEHEKWVK